MEQQFIDFISPYLASLLGAYAVPVITLIGVIFVALKMVGTFKQLCENVKHNDGYESLEKQMQTLIKQYQDLQEKYIETKKQHNELLTEITKIKHE